MSHTAMAEDAEEAEKTAVSVSFTDDFEARYWRSPKRLVGFPDREVFNYMEQVNRMTGTVNSGPWSLFWQVDEVALFFNQYRLDGDLFSERELTKPSLNSFWPGASYANPEKLQVSGVRVRPA